MDLTICDECLNTGLNVVHEPCTCVMGRQAVREFRGHTCTAPLPEPTMKADDARELVRQAVEKEAGQRAILLTIWYGAIGKAATSGHRSVRESELGRPRCPISEESRLAARAQLIADGFKVEQVRTGINESTYEVSW